LLGYPTFLAPAGAGGGKAGAVGGYPVGVFPYCVLVDGRGRVAAHGPLADVIAAAEAEARKAFKE
jgi:hypothetical protein